MLKPTIVAITKTHVLRARIFGWHAVERKDMDHTIFVEKLYGKKAHGQDLSNVVAKLKYRSFPSMWALDKQGKSLLRLDGRVWDAKTMSTVASKLSDQTTVYKKANVLDIDRLHHGLITFTELHPGWKSATMAILAVLIVAILGGAAILPEDIGTLNPPDPLEATIPAFCTGQKEKKMRWCASCTKPGCAPPLLSAIKRAA